MLGKIEHVIEHVLGWVSGQDFKRSHIPIGHGRSLENGSRYL